MPLPDALLLAVRQRVVRAGRQPPGCLGRSFSVVDSIGSDRITVPARFPDHLLLLSQGLLPVGVAVTDRLRGPRTACALHGRDPASADRSEQPPLLLLLRDCGVTDQ